MGENTWVFYVVFAIVILVAIIGLVLLIEAISRLCFAEKRGLIITDGGQPSSPGHNYSYTFNIKVDSASPSFDEKDTIIKIDLLDNRNHFLTCVAVPSFKFIYRTVSLNKESNSKSPNKEKEPQDRLQLLNNQKVLNEHQIQTITPSIRSDNLDGALIKETSKNSSSQPLTSQTNSPVPDVLTETKPVLASDSPLPGYAILKGRRQPTHYKSLSNLREQWSSIPKSSEMTFHLIRRFPLQNFYSVRLAHDCYKPSAYITIEKFTIRDDSLKQVAQININGSKIYGKHPCPPTGEQIFLAEAI